MLDWLENRVQKARNTFAALKMQVICEMTSPAFFHQIASCEASLGITLSPSHRAFFLITNGMRLQYTCIIEEGENRFKKIGGYLNICSLEELSHDYVDHKSWRNETATEELRPQDRWGNLIVCCDYEDGNLIVLDPENISVHGEYRALNADHEMTPSIWRRDLVIADSLRTFPEQLF